MKEAIVALSVVSALLAITCTALCFVLAKIVGCEDEGDLQTEN